MQSTYLVAFLITVAADIDNTYNVLISSLRNHLFTVNNSTDKYICSMKVTRLQLIKLMNCTINYQKALIVTTTVISPLYKN